MANIKFVNAAGKYQDDTARHDLIHYMTQRKKIPNHIVGFSHGDISNAADLMTQTARSFGKDQGVRIYHFIITFAPGDVNDIEYILYATNEISRLLGQRHETAYAVHEDTRIPHIHFAFNPVSFVDGYKYHGGKEEFKELMETLGEVMRFIGVFAFYRVKNKPMKADDAQSLLTRCAKAIINAVLMSESISKEANPCTMYLDAFFRLVERGEIRLAENIKTYLPEVHDGFLADQTAWVDYNEVYAKVTWYYNRLNVTFPLKEQQLAIHLADAELIEVTYEDRDGRSRRHYTQKSSLPNRKRMQVLHLDRAQSYLEENANN